MDRELLQIKGVSRYGLKARLASKRAQNRWHFGPKDTNGKEPVDSMVWRIRQTGPLRER